jgi:hypothetical protein
VDNALREKTNPGENPRLEPVDRYKNTVINEYQLMDHWCLDHWKELLNIENSYLDGPFPSNNEFFPRTSSSSSCFSNNLDIHTFQKIPSSCHYTIGYEMIGLK